MRRYLLTCSMLLVGCPEPDSASDGEPATTAATDDGLPDEDSGADSSGGEPADPFDMLHACDEADFEATPWAGPAFDPESGELLEPLEPPYIIATTVGWPKPDQASLDELGELTGAIVEDVFTHEGFLGGTFGSSPSCAAARTLTLWRDRAAMMEFALGGPHLQAIPRAPITLQAWEQVNWEETTATTPPTWETADARLVEAHNGG